MQSARNSAFARQVLKAAKLLETLAAVAQLQSPVLLIGPRCTSIELLARTLHECSPRAAAPFILVRCGLYPGQTLEARLFGRGPIKNSFLRTAAQAHGRITAADGGTLFLDQVHNTTPSIQAALLRLVEDGEFTRPDGATHRVNARLIVSAWADLDQRVTAGSFRADLLYRLNALTVTLPRGFASKQRLLDTIQFLRTAPPADEHVWPPEVRALQRAIAAAQFPADAPTEQILVAAVRRLARQQPESHARRYLQAVDAALQGCIQASESFGERFFDTLVTQVQRIVIQRALAHCDGITSRAAEILGLSVHALEQKLRELAPLSPFPDSPAIA